MIERDDKANHDDVLTAIEALQKAEGALRKAMEGQGQAEREQFDWAVHFARGRLARVSERISGVEDVPDAP